MIDYQLASKGVEKLLSVIPDQTDIERLTTHATITHLIDEMEKVLEDRLPKGNDGGTGEKLAFLRLHAAQACGLVDFGKSLDQYIVWARGSLRTLNSILERMGTDLSFQ